MNSNENDHGVTFYCEFHAAGASEGVYTPINSVIVIETGLNKRGLGPSCFRGHMKDSMLENKIKTEMQ